MHCYKVKFMLKGLGGWRYTDILISDGLPNTTLLQVIHKVLVRRFGSGIVQFDIEKEYFF